jgi:membrane protease YdiL (CAAX protease family)
MAKASSAASLSNLRNLAAALTIAGLVIGGEYLFRHYVLFLFPIFGTLLVNDMLSLFLVYSLLTVSLGALLHTNWRQELPSVGQALRTGLTSWSFMIWFLALMLSIVALPIADRFLWENIKLAMVLSSFRNPTVWFASLSPILEAVSLVLVNGLFVPIAEEYLWRGLVQVRLVSRLRNSLT